MTKMYVKYSLENLRGMKDGYVTEAKDKRLVCVSHDIRRNGKMLMLVTSLH